LLPRGIKKRAWAGTVGPPQARATWDLGAQKLDCPARGSESAFRLRFLSRKVQGGRPVQLLLPGTYWLADDWRLSSLVTKLLLITSDAYYSIENMFETEEYKIGMKKKLVNTTSEYSEKL
jgi:hypothetical protein